MDSDASISPRRRSCYSDSGDSFCSEPFSECGSDDLSFNPAAAAGIDRLLLSCVAEASDDSISSLVAELESPSASVDSLRRAAMELRLLAKHNPDNRIRIAASKAVRPLVALLSQADPLLQEHGITALLNLSICDENAACALLRLSQLDGHAAVGRAGAIPLLMSLLETGGPRGKKDAATALYALCSGARENRLRSGLAGARPARTTPLVEAPGMGGGVDVEAMAVVGGHVQVRVARRRWLGRLVRAVAALENLRLAVLHLAVTSVGNDAVVYCFKALLDEREETSVAAMVRFVLVGIPGA